jgi:membrane protease YdiL (CAAX protease family)
MSVATAPNPPAPPSPALRGGPLDVIRRGPLRAFVVLALALSWIAWIPYILSNHGLGVWDFSYPGGAGQLFGLLPGAYLGPIGSALFVTAVTEGRAGLRAWARRLWHWKVSWRWYVGILLSVPAVMVVSGLLFSGGTLHAPSMQALVAYVPMLLIQMVTTGLAEEPGWRDFALPRAQRRYGAPTAAVLIGLLWGVWHLPLYLTEWGQWPDVAWYRPLEFVAFCITLNVVMTWVFNRTGQSLPMAMLLHVSINTTASTVWEEIFPGIGVDGFQHLLLLASTVAAVVVLRGTRGRLGYEPDGVHPGLDHRLTTARAS